MADGDVTKAGVGQGRTGNQAFWTLVVAAPALLSVLRLWVESGGELQTTLLLVENVDPINLIAALVATTSWLAATALVSIFAVGGVLLAGGDAGRGFIFARWASAAPRWLVFGGFLLAAVTWQILYLPMLLLALVAAFQIRWFRPGHRILSVGAVLAGLIGYGYLCGPTVSTAWHGHEYVALLLIVAPPVLALGITGPVWRALMTPVAVFSHAACVVFLLVAAAPVITTPVLPLTVVVVVAGGDAAPPQYLRGHVIAVDDVSTLLLREAGGVQYIPSDDIEAEFLCPTEEDLPEYRLWLRGFRVEDSLLRGVGREIRQASPLNAACRAAPDQSPG